MRGFWWVGDGLVGDSLGRVAQMTSFGMADLLCCWGVFVADREVEISGCGHDGRFLFVWGSSSLSLADAVGGRLSRPFVPLTGASPFIICVLVQVSAACLVSSASQSRRFWN